ncbi:MAG: GEVED domain-containing protein [Chitinophagaceae bacterium]
MKKFCNLLFILAVCISFTPVELEAQCGPGYTQTQLNWDNLDYYFNSGGSSPYPNYVSDAQEMTQRFIFGTTYLTIGTSSNALINPGTGGTVSVENATHTGEIAGYTGEDVQYNPSSNGQTITITFNTEVQNLNFTLYDVDRSQRLDFSALNASSVAQNINVVTYASSILTVTNNNASNAYITASSSSLANSSNQGSATITVTGSVKTFTITVTTVGSDQVFWLSDINACVSGTFPTNWHQGFNNQPWQGNVENQPDYFLVTPDNNSAYMMDPATGRCYWLFTDASKTYMNSFAYDPQNRVLYYISENVSINSNNKTLKKWDFATETTSTVIADIGATLGIPTFNYGVESAGAAFYNGKLYLGIEGGQNTGTWRESMVWCIDLSTNTAYQVYATNCYNSTQALHDYADFIIKDGTLINYNSARTSSPTTYPNSSFTHYDFITGGATTYMNPNPANRYSSQAGLSWNGSTYMIYDSVWTYNAGVISNPQRATVVTVPGDPAPPAWAGNAGDASDPFRPKCDFGDAPASYDPNPIKPAVHERSEAIRLGATWDKEWVKRGISGTDDVDDGTPFLNFLPQGSGNYLAFTYATNNSGSPAQLIAWLDYNGNGVFDASEAIPAITVPTGTNNQLYYLYWPSFTTPLVNGQTTYMRIRITSGAMTSADATGYFSNGEVEDYRVIVDNFPLSVNTLSFSATLINSSTARLQWTASEQNSLVGYEIQKSTDGMNWDFVALVQGKGIAGEHSYEYTDDNLAYGKTFYRLRIAGSAGNKISDVRYVQRLYPNEIVRVRPNPVRSAAYVSIEAFESARAEVQLFTESGKQVYQDLKMLNTGSNLLTIPVRGAWAPGVYILRIVMNREVFNKKLIIEK